MIRMFLKGSLSKTVPSLQKLCEPNYIKGDSTLKVSIMTAAGGNLEYFFYCFSEKLRLDISHESSAGQRIHMKHQALFPSKDKSKKINKTCHRDRIAHLTAPCPSYKKL